MKKLNIIAGVALAVISVTGCENLLDVNPKGSPTTTTYFQNDDQAEAATIPLYYELFQESMFGREEKWEQCCGTMVVPGRVRGYPDLFTMNWTGEESPLTATFSNAYVVMHRANWIVKSLLDKQKKQELTYVETRTLGEAYCVRALVHFFIAYRYGTKDQGVPAVRYEDTEGSYEYKIPPQQESVMKNYEMIISDLQNAEKCLPDVRNYSASEAGRASKQSAVALMARVYTFWATWDNTQWNNVVTAVTKLEKEYGRKLLPSYSQLFSDDISTWWHEENCWSIPGNGDPYKCGAAIAGICLENKGWGLVNGWGQFKPSYDCYEEFKKDGDRDVNERLRRSILEYNCEFLYNGEVKRYYGAEDVEAGFQINKWMEPYSHKDFCQGYVDDASHGNRINYFIVRFADCLLYRAEAYINLEQYGNAAKDLNAIRKRAGLAETCTGTLQEIYHERICELSFEFFSDHAGDLKRWALSAKSPLKEMAIAELEAHPRALTHVYRDLPSSPIGKGVDPDGTTSDFPDGKTRVKYKSINDYGGTGVAPYEDYLGREAKWDAHLAVFPYSAAVIKQSAGELKQNAGY